MVFYSVKLLVMKNKKLTYQEAYIQLEEIFNKIKEEKVPIEELAETIQRAKYLINYCEEVLRNVENEIGTNGSDSKANNKL